MRRFSSRLALVAVMGMLTPAGAAVTFTKPDINEQFTTTTDIGCNGGGGTPNWSYGLYCKNSSNVTEQSTSGSFNAVGNWDKVLTHPTNGWSVDGPGANHVITISPTGGSNVPRVIKIVP